PGVIALSGINFDLFPGEVHVVLGENGAGKSTLIKILSGIYRPDEGEIELDGQVYHHITPKLARHLGIATIFQELSTINELTIAENLFVGHQPMRKILGVPVVDYREMHNRAEQTLERLGIEFDVTRVVGTISISEKQLLEIAKALLWNARVIVMDEPTSSLTQGETRNLFELIAKLKAQNVAIIYISHKLDEIGIVGDRLTVLKDGQHVGPYEVATTSKDEMISMMVGRKLKNKLYRRLPHERPENPEELLNVVNLTRKDRKVRKISFKLFSHEILGFAGLMGSGRTELMEAIFRAVDVQSDSIYLKGKQLHHRNPYEAVRNGIALVTEDRRETGFFSNFNIWENISIVHEVLGSRFGGLVGHVDNNIDQQIAEEERKRLAIKCLSVNQSINDLSGGNQQKVIIGKWLACDPTIVIFDEPTRGIDVGAKSEIYTIIRTLSDKGVGIIVVSSELPELLSICDRIIVFNSGRIVASLPIDEATEGKIMFEATKDVSLLTECGVQ
ncbi:MAG: sugar ABC transporter ATP-binding protein, partial [Candidatus Thiodiazotropha sp. (ex Rostrolucina anterorostrata)]|nr:sugar ABC transporter ATP-binding protein [Candidatus Thiodiazotropha sp. (ex Rostrolucina anterorostrata)]